MTVQDIRRRGVKIGIYGVGVGFAVAGALGIAEAIDLPLAIAGLSFILGLGAVLAVHEYLGGPF